MDCCFFSVFQMMQLTRLHLRSLTLTFLQQTVKTKKRTTRMTMIGGSAVVAYF